MAINHIHLAAYWRPIALPLEVAYDCAVDELTVVLSAKGLV